jgi:hypothetical protein
MIKVGITSHDEPARPGARPLMVRVDRRDSTEGFPNMLFNYRGALVAEITRKGL